MRVLWVITTSAPPVERRYASMPRDTTPSASTSRPESVSSRMASLGRSNSNCSISSFFFSPPEKPTPSSRSRYDGSMSSSSASARTCFLNCLPLSSPSRPAIVARRKLDSGTPGISTGAWKLRNSPARERLSGERSVMSWPSNSTVPPSTV